MVFFGAVLFWYVLEVTIDVFERPMSSAFRSFHSRLKYIYWIGPIGTLQFLLTGCVQLVRVWSANPPPLPRRGRGGGSCADTGGSVKDLEAIPMRLAQAAQTGGDSLPLVGRGWGWGSRECGTSGGHTHHPLPQPSPTRGEDEPSLPLTYGLSRKPD